MHDHPGVGLAAALDVDESALREAKKRNPQLSAVVGDLFQLPFQDNAFDLVFNSSTVEHLDDPGAAVCEMQRVCQQGGHVFVGVPYSLGPLAIQRAICNTRLGIWLGPVFTPRSLRTLLRQAQLEPIDSITYFWRFFVGVIARRRLVTTGAGA
jgi:SAM-dependent methyltransferase